MTYRLSFKESALKEFNKLNPDLQRLFKKALIARLDNPRIDSARLNGLKDCYKIKLRASGYRLVYQVRDLELIITVITVGKRERNAVYKLASKRI